MSEYHLHVGVDPRSLKAALDAVPGEVIIDGDGWEVWAEPIGTDNNDDRTLHVVIPVGSREEADGLVAALREGRVLTPMRQNVGGVPADAVLTDASNWSALDGVEGLYGTHVYWSPCSWCGADVMDEDACPNLKDVCEGCAGDC